MPYKKILQLWKRLTKNKERIKKLPEIPEVYIKKSIPTRFGKTIMSKGLKESYYQ